MIGTGEELAVARTPLRLSLGGGGTDLPVYSERYGGDMVTAAISLWVTVIARRGRLDGRYRFSHEQTETVDDAGRFGHTYVREALDMVGVSDSCEVVSMGPVPPGTGLGSSGAFAVSLLAVLHALAGRRPFPVELAEQAYQLEAGRLGMPIGKQDHYACALGGLRRLVIDTSGAVSTSPVATPEGVAAELERRLVLFYTGRRRNSATRLAVPNAVVAQDRVEQLHRIRSLGDGIRSALENGSLDDIPRLMAEHWAVKRSGESDPRWDEYLETARRHGAKAGKVVGAGGGGFLLVYVEPPTASAVIAALKRSRLQHVPARFVTEGTTLTLLSAPCGGAALLEGAQ